MTNTNRKVPVSEGALVQRINRKLAKAGQVLRRSRSQRARLDLGDFYVLEPNRNWIIATHIDLEAYAAEIGSIGAWEALVQ